jgi:hypothetical protein
VSAAVPGSTGGITQSLIYPPAARYTATCATAPEPGPRRGLRRTEPHPGRAWASSNFDEAVMYNFILPIKEDA